MKLLFFVCFCFFYTFTVSVNSMTVFASLEEQSPLAGNYRKLLNTPLGSRLKKNGDTDTTDPYEMALLLTRVFSRLSLNKDTLYFENEPWVLSEEALQSMEQLIPELKQQLQWLKQDPEEMTLRLNSYRQLTARYNANPVKKKEKNSGIQIDNLSLKNSFKTGETAQTIQSLMNFTYRGFHKLDNWLELKTDGQDYIGTGNFGLRWQPGKLVDEVQVGQYHRPIGLGLNGATLVKGFELGREYQEHQLRLGWFDGLFASIETPWILNMPFTFYTMQEQKRNGLESDLFHSGVFFHKNFGDGLRLSTEFTESIAPGSPVNRQQDNAAFALSLTRKSGKLALQSGISHVGSGFIGRRNQSRLLDEIPETIRKNVQISLSNYFGNPVSIISGSSDLGFGVSYRLGKRNQLELQQNFLYDHSTNNANAHNGFNLSTLRYSHHTENKSLFQISLQNLAWENPGTTATSGFAAGYRRRDFTLVQSSYTYSF
jgi:hypothetical protein